MLEILFIMFAIFALAKKGRGRRRRFNLRRVRITPELALGTLASDTVLNVGFLGAADGAYRCMTINATYSVKGLTGGEGPITFGYAHSDYSVTEIKECLEASNSISQGLKIEQERANRLVRVIGTLSQTGASMLNDGRPVKTRLNWLVAIGDQVNLFAFNESTAALSTGCVVNVQGDMWVKDST